MKSQSTRQTYSSDTALAGIWREHHRYLLNVAYRMMGSVSEAEDIVQDAFARLLRIDLSEINDIRGWLVVAVTRRCLDELRSARSRREVYVGPWLPEPVIEPENSTLDPADRITLDDSVRMAMLLVLERLSPPERAAFVLHDVFQFNFDEVGEIVGKSPAACRQLASRARKHVREDSSPARFQTDPVEAKRVADRFIEAATNGDLQALMQVLDPNVAGHTDGGGVVSANRVPLMGRDTVARGLIGFLSKFNATLKPMNVNGEQGALVLQDGKLLGIVSIEIRDGFVVHLHAVANPYKLAYAASLLDAEMVTDITTGTPPPFGNLRPNLSRGGSAD